MAGIHVCRSTTSSRIGVVWLLLLGMAVAFAGGCASRDRLHPGLRLNDDELSSAIKRGKRLIPTGEPEQAFSFRTVDVNTQISSDVILRKAGPCWPEDEVAYQIALGGDSSDAAVKQATNVGLKIVERQMRFVAILQVSKERDPADIEFALRTNQGTEYPPVSVEAPKFIRSVNPTFDPTAKPAGLYAYTVHFPVAGGPGVPPIGPTAYSLEFIVKVDDSEGSARFTIPKDREVR
ncbi:MAG: hypothetical protein JXA57_12115 [Armatimonadetes bacterium]|nr:hypothetical protein [Armatimonadota bacterium]